MGFSSILFSYQVYKPLLLIYKLINRCSFSYIPLILEEYNLYVDVSNISSSSDPVSSILSFNGAWNDGSTGDKTVTLTGNQEESLKLSADQIPAVGDKPGNNYKAGSWNTTSDTTTAITEDTTFTYTYASADNNGNIDNEVVQNPDTPKSTVEGMTNELAESLMTDDEKALVKSGASSKLTLEITNTDNTVSQEDNNLTENVVKKENGKAVVAMYLDISLFLRVGSTQRQIDSTGQRKLTVNLEVPSRFWAPFGVRRTFFVVRTHKNNAETIAKSTENIVPVDTGLFSTYALAYVDEPVNVVRFDSGLKISQKNAKIKASVKMENAKKKALPDDHVAKLRYRSNNQNVAKVDSKGNVTAVGTGTCTVYVYAKNGFAKKVAVTVN